MITYIEISKLHPHHDNPRKDLGDLTELAESIKSNGIFQNLTVVPQESGYCTSCKLYISGVGKCSEGHDNNERPPCRKWESDGSYTVVIGHRRLAAAKLAGLTEVPCAIATMTPKEQIATMLLENIQRSDLTIYEQAQGFQMMLNLGDSINDISERTGFAVTTVRRRIKLMELDDKKLKEAVDRGATLMDFAELEKIQDLKLRNKVLEKIGTSNFKWELQSALNDEMANAVAATIIATLETFAKKTTDTSNHQYIRGFNAAYGSTVTVPEDAKTEEYFYTVSGNHYFALYKKRGQSEPASEQDEKRKEQLQRRTALEEISKRAYQLRKDFVRDISNAKAKKGMSTIIEFAMRIMCDDYFSLDAEDFEELLGIEAEVNEDEDWSFENIAENVTAQPERCLLAAIYLGLDSEGEHYYNWNNQYDDNKNLNRTYSFLEKFGYEMSDEERALRDGTHELFKNSDT